jgi:DNA-binding beta-propeller fold protein YncE
MIRAIQAAILTTLYLLAAPVGPSGYREVNKVAIPGTGGWDYVTVDAAARRVYVSHATQVEVLDADSLKVIGTISDTPGVHGIAVAPEVGKGFITAGKVDAVVVFDLTTLKSTSRVPTGKKPDAIVYDSASKQVFAMNGSSDSATAINAADGTVSGTIALGGGPEFAVVDGKGSLWVNLEDKSEMLQIDTKALKVVNRWPLAPCQEPSSLAFDAQNRRLFAGCRNRVLAIVDADSGKVLKTYPIGDHVDAGGFDPGSKRVFLSTGDGHISIFQQDTPDAYTLVESMTTYPASKTMGMDLKTGRIFLPTNQGGFSVAIYDKQ